MSELKLSEKQLSAIHNAPIHLYWSEHSGNPFYQSDDQATEYRVSTIESLVNKGLLEQLEVNFYTEFHLTEKGRTKLI